MRLQPTDRVPHWESLANPAFEQLVTGIDPWEHPQKARQRLLELLAVDVALVPTSDDPLERLPEGQLTFVDEQGSRSARWGAGRTWRWDWGKGFASIEDVLAYNPLEHMDQRDTAIVAEYDYRLSVDELAEQLQADLDASRGVTGQRALETMGFYNTLFMWPLLTFGWELFLELGGLYQEEMSRLLSQFAERSRKFFRAVSQTDVEVVTSHDDICYRRGPIFRPDWLRKMMCPYYEEFWGYLHEAGIVVIFVSDGNVDAVADDIFACGADGIRSEPYTNWPAIAAKHPDKVLVGDGDNRVISTGDPQAIREMVKRMTGWGKRYPGYFCSLGNLLPWNLPPEGLLSYFQASDELGRRE